MININQRKTMFSAPVNPMDSFMMKNLSIAMTAQSSSTAVLSAATAAKTTTLPASAVLPMPITVSDDTSVPARYQAASPVFTPSSSFLATHNDGGVAIPAPSTEATPSMRHEPNMVNLSEEENNYSGCDVGTIHNGERWIWVLDPLTRKLRVPVRYLIPTQATATSGTVPSLCIAYLEGRCRHPCCRQAHVFPSAIPQLRQEALNAPTCCHLHKDPHDISCLTSRFRYIRVIHNVNHSHMCSSNCTSTPTYAVVNTTTGSSSNSTAKKMNSTSTVCGLNTHTCVNGGVVNDTMNRLSRSGYCSVASVSPASGHAVNMDSKNDLRMSDPTMSMQLIPTERVASTVGLLRYLVHNLPSKKCLTDAHAAAATAAAAIVNIDGSSNTNNSVNVKSDSHVSSCHTSSSGNIISDRISSAEDGAQNATDADSECMSNGNTNNAHDSNCNTQVNTRDCTCGNDKEQLHVDSSPKTFSRTPDNDDVDESDILDLPARFICRLHLAHRCRYLEDCNNIHICRRYEPMLQQPSSMMYSSLSSVSATTRAVTVGDVCYSVTPLLLCEVSDKEFDVIQEMHRGRLSAANTSTLAHATAPAPSTCVSAPASTLLRGVTAPPFTPVSTSIFSQAHANTHASNVIAATAAAALTNKPDVDAISHSTFSVTADGYSSSKRNHADSVAICANGAHEHVMNVCADGGDYYGANTEYTEMSLPLPPPQLSALQTGVRLEGAVPPKSYFAANATATRMHGNQSSSSRETANIHAGVNSRRPMFMQLIKVCDLSVRSNAEDEANDTHRTNAATAAMRSDRGSVTSEKRH